METRSIIGLFVAFIVLAAFSVMIINGGSTATVLTAFGNAFRGILQAATLQKSE